MAMNEIRMAVLDSLEDERKIAAQSVKTARVKIERGHAWMVRFLPFGMGTKNTPWARLSQHWVNSKPCFCKQHTAPEFGGDPSYECPICQVADSMHSQATDDKERDDFYGVQARTYFLMYCSVIVKETDRGDRTESTLEEMLIPHEFNIPKSSFPLLAQKLERSKNRKGGSPGLGFLDLELGQDIWVARDKKNSLSFELSDEGPAPLFALDENFDAYIARLWKALKQPSVKFFDDDRLTNIADKIAERAFEKAGEVVSDGRGDSRGGSGRGRRYNSEEHDDEPARGRGRSRAPEADDEPQVTRPTRPVRAAAPAPAAPVRTTRPIRVAQAQVEEEQPAMPEPDDSNPELMPVSTEDQAQVQDQDQGQEQAPEQDYPEKDDQDQGQEAAPAEEPPTPPVRRVAAATSRLAPARTVATPPAVAAARRSQQATTPPVRVAAPAARRESTGGQIEDDPEQVPEEATDPAPPKAAALPPRPAATRPVPPRTAPAAGPSKFVSTLGPRIQGLRERQQ